jgi:hypothetical protein
MLIAASKPGCCPRMMTVLATLLLLSSDDDSAHCMSCPPARAYWGLGVNLKDSPK